MTCHDNVAFPLREKLQTPPEELNKRVEAALGQVGLEGVGAKYPAESPAACASAWPSRGRW